ncbi:hypothetical protein EVAR_88513_1 [Eumeta japonica]|uniref:Uncharacterized protein n=1 Tax=Eumeta variegata TaxID=151549 RepID=A0A4C1XTM5_EUMVA|nr:hypothetical protein EVAR_88513_1 [Eumeta japonica]
MYGLELGPSAFYTSPARVGACEIVSRSTRLVESGASVRGYGQKLEFDNTVYLHSTICHVVHFLFSLKSIQGDPIRAESTSKRWQCADHAVCYDDDESDTGAFSSPRQGQVRRFTFFSPAIAAAVAPGRRRRGTGIEPPTDTWRLFSESRATIIIAKNTQLPRHVDGGSRQTAKMIPLTIFDKTRQGTPVAGAPAPISDRYVVTRCAAPAKRYRSRGATDLWAIAAR